MKRTLSSITCLAAATALTLSAQVAKVDPAIAGYQKASGVSGNLSSIGSDTMNNLMTLWAETFRKYYPNVKVQVEGKGSSTAPPALIAGTAQFGPMSRQMRSTEIDQFEQRYGYKPTEIRTSYDALAVYVHKDNPIKELTLAQVEAIFGKSRKRGYKQNVTTWGQLGLTGDWANRPIGLYGRNSASGTYGFFKEHRPQERRLQGHREGAAGLGVGRAGRHRGPLCDRLQRHRVPDVRRACGAARREQPAGPFFEGTYEDVLAGKYPLCRFLYVYVNKAPGKPLDPLPLEFLKLVMSREGQEVVVKDGYMPLTPAIAKEELAKITGAAGTQ